MNNTQLKKNISILYDMELNNYLMTEMISRLDDKINSLGRKKKFATPKKARGDKEIVTSCTLIGAIIIAVIAAVGGLIYNFTDPEAGLFDKILGVVFYPVGWGGVGALIGLVLGLIAGLICYSKEKREIEKIYEEDCNEHNNALKKDAVRISNEKREKEILIRQKESLVKRKNEAAEKLKSFYAASGIDSKYRNLIPIGYMHEFIRLGIATHLEGADGLYYLVRNELRADQFQCSIEEISCKLDTVIDKQREIYGVISDMNHRCDYLVEQTKKSIKLSAQNNALLSSAVEQTKITAYNTERIAKETEFQNYMLMYR